VIATLADHARRAADAVAEAVQELARRRADWERIAAELAELDPAAADALERDLTRRRAAIRGPLVPPPDGAGSCNAPMTRGGAVIARR
jgi:hypothetical protein